MLASFQIDAPSVSVRVSYYNVRRNNAIKTCIFVRMCINIKKLIKKLFSQTSSEKMTTKNATIERCYFSPNENQFINVS